MDISFYKFAELKNKFANLLAHLYSNAHLEIDNISDELINNSFLDILEDNNIDKFLSLSYEAIALQLFPNTNYYETKGKDIGPLYWCGLQYMNIFLNYRIPLRTILLLLPIKEMVKKYDVFHEMNEISLCQSFLQNEYKNHSILRYFREKRKISIRQLSILSNISEAAIKRMELNNEYFYSQLLNNANALKSALSIDETFFHKKSEFIPINYFLFDNKDFVALLKKVIAEHFNKNYFDELELVFDPKKVINKDGSYLLLNSQALLIIHGKEKHIDNIIFNKLVDITIDLYIKKYLTANLVF